MDSARFGRVLGAGARGAAKTLFAAVDAASAPSPRNDTPRVSASHPSPRPGAQPSASSRSDAAGIPSPPPAGTTARPGDAPIPRPAGGAGFAAITDAARASAGVAEGTRRFNRAVAQPVRRLSGVLWLEFTGVFFGLFAVSAAIGAWRLWGATHATAGDSAIRSHFFFAAAIAVVFAYFCISSFIRARRRSRQT